MKIEGESSRKSLRKLGKNEMDRENLVGKLSSQEACPKRESLK